MDNGNLDNLARACVEFLREENAVRVSKDEVCNYKTVYEICEKLDIRVDTDWPRLKNYMLSRGYSIVYIPRKGHYLGFKGEEVANYVYKYKIARGWVKHLHATKDAINASSPEARDWMKLRFKDFTTEEEFANA